MKMTNCNIIKDILPLYADGVVSQDTEKMVAEHLKDCEACQKELETIKKQIALPINKATQLEEAKVLKSFKKALRNKKVIVSLASVVATLVLILGGYSLMTLVEWYIPYDSAKMPVVITEDGSIYADFDENYACAYAFEQESLEINGVEKHILVYHYSQSLWAKYVEPLLPKKGNVDTDAKGTMFYLGEADQLDEVYYGDFDSDHFDSEFQKNSDKMDKVWDKQE